MKHIFNLKKETDLFFETYYGLFKDHGRISIKYLYEHYLENSSDKGVVNPDALATVFVRYLQIKGHYFRIEENTFYFYKRTI